MARLRLFFESDESALAGFGGVPDELVDEREEGRGRAHEHAYKALG